MASTAGHDSTGLFAPNTMATAAAAEPESPSSSEDAAMPDTSEDADCSPPSVRYEYVRVGCKGSQQREKDKVLRQMVPIAEAWSREYVENKNRVWIPLFSECSPQHALTGNTTEDWKQAGHVVRYFGMADLRVDFTGMTRDGRELELGDVSHSLSSAAEGKALLREYFRTYLIGATLQEVCDTCPEFGIVTERMFQLMKQLQQHLPPAHRSSIVCFYTGDDGFRVLWFDPRLGIRVDPTTRYDQSFIEHIAPQYFQDTLDLPVDVVDTLDTSIYEHHKGMRINCTCHPKTGFVPILLNGNEEEMRTTLLIDAESIHVHPALTDRTLQYWQALPSHLAEAECHNNDAWTIAVQSLGRAVEKLRIASSPTSSSSSFSRASRSGGASCGTPVLSEGEQVMLLQRLEAFHPRWKEQIQREGERRLRCTKTRVGATVYFSCPALRHCAVADRDHGRADKIYFMYHSATGELTQSCHSGKCLNGWVEVVEQKWDTLLQRALNDRELLELPYALLKQAARSWCTDAETIKRKEAVLQAVSPSDIDAAVRLWHVHRSAFESRLIAVLNRFWIIMDKGASPVYVEFIERAVSGRVVAQRRKDAVAAGLPTRTHYTDAAILRRNNQAKFVEAHRPRRLTLLKCVQKTEDQWLIVSDSLQLASWWLEHEERRTCDAVVCDPHPLASFRIVNLWRGPDITPELCMRYRRDHPNYEELAKPYFEHLRLVWCRNDEKRYDYVRKWLAMTLQQPERKIKVALVVVGAPGSGKGVVMAFMQRILGNVHYSQVMGVGELLDRFNANTTLANKLLLIDESSWGGMKAEAGHLKSMVTEDTVRSQAKYLDAEYIESYSNLVFYSNDPFPVCVEAGDRRFVSLETDDRFAGPENGENGAYFKAVWATPALAVASVLYAEKLDAFEPRRIPHSPFRQRAQIKSFPAESVLKWLMTCLDREELPGEGVFEMHTQAYVAPILEWETPRIKRQVYEDYKAQAGPRALGESDMWRDLKRILPGLQTKQHRSHAYVASVQCIRFPPLETCKQAFRDKMQTPGWVFQAEEDEEEAMCDAAVEAERKVAAAAAVAPAGTGISAALVRVEGQP